MKNKKSLGLLLLYAGNLILGCGIVALYFGTTTSVYGQVTDERIKTPAVPGFRRYIYPRYYSPKSYSPESYVRYFWGRRFRRSLTPTSTNLVSLQPTETLSATEIPTQTPFIDDTTETNEPTLISTATPTQTMTSTIIPSPTHNTPTNTNTSTSTSTSTSTATSTSTNADVPVSTSSFYVSLAGSDSNPGTEDSPWRTISYSISKARPGDTIYVRSGQYNGMLQVFNKNGEADKPITIRSYPGEQVIVNSDDWAGIYFNGSSRIVINGLIFTGASYDGVYITNSNYIVIENCISFNNGGVGIHISSIEGSANSNVIQNCEVYNNDEEGIYVDVKVSNLVPVENNAILNNRVFDNGYEGIQNTNQEGKLPKPNGTIIKGNQVENNGADWASFDLGGNNLTVSDNYITNNYAPGGGIYYADGSGSVISNNEIHNNFMSFESGDGIIINNVTNTLIQNNVIYSTLGVSDTGVSVLGSSENNTLDNNIKIK